MITTSNISPFNLLRAYDKSLIKLVDDKTSVTANSALLQLNVPHIDLGVQPASMVGAKVLVEMGVDRSMHLAIVIRTHEQTPDVDEINELRISKVLRKATGTSQLAEIVRGMGLSHVEIVDMRVTKALGVVLWNGLAAIGMVFDRVPGAGHDERIPGSQARLAGIHGKDNVHSHEPGVYRTSTYPVRF